MSKLPLLTAILLVCYAAALHAQDAPSPAPVPVPPFVQELPDYSTWRVVYTQHALPATTAPVKPSSADARAPAPRLRKETRFTKTGSDVRMVTVWSDGTSSEEWRSHGVILYTQPGSTYVYTMDLSEAGRQSFATAANHTFPELSWLSVACYVGTQSQKNAQAYVFEQKEVAPAKDPGPDLTIPTGHPAQKAWIEQGTKLPLVFDDGYALRTYEYQAPPTAPLSLPPAFADALARYLRGVAANRHEVMKL